jgi:8-oxo-dGTP diphosphatase
VVWTPDASPTPVLVPCVGAVLTDGARLLLVQRGHDPGRGLWSIPGGRVEPGESDEQAVVRETLEETGLSVTCGPLLGSVQRLGPAGVIYDIRDYRAFAGDGELAAGDDAADVRWVSFDEAEALHHGGQLTSDLLATLKSWSVLP